MLDKVWRMVGNHPKLEPFYTDITEEPLVAGRFLVYSGPTVLLLLDGEEVYRASGFIDIVDYLERVPDSYVPGRRKLIAKKQQQIEQQQMMQQMMAMGMPPGMMPPPSGEADVPQAGVQNPMQGMGMGMPMMGGPPSPTPPTPTPNPQPSGGDEGKPISAYLNKDPEITGGRGYRAAARAVNGQA